MILYNINIALTCTCLYVKICEHNTMPYSRVSITLDVRGSLHDTQYTDEVYQRIMHRVFTDTTGCRFQQCDLRLCVLYQDRLTNFASHDDK